jgi:fumarate hydratase class II
MTSPLRPDSRDQEIQHMPSDRYRVERDSMGEIEVPAGALWGAQTQRAIANFRISGLRLPREFIRALGLIKWAAARSNAALGVLDEPRARAIQRAALEIAGGAHDEQFPVDVFQTGSGTSSNMNANEVIATLASRQAGALDIHPNDHVNRSQSSNDVIPTAIHVAASLSLRDHLLPSLEELANSIEHKSVEVSDVVKTGRTHLMDAMPLTMGQELSGWRSQVLAGMTRLCETGERLHELAQGGTAVGTGVNADPRFPSLFASELSEKTGVAFRPSDNFFRSISSQDTAVEFSGQLRTLAVSLMKVSNDLRWMNSGPLAGLAEVALPSLQPGSSIMPGKVNPVFPEAVAMACAQVIGNDATIALAGQSGSFQLNVMLPVIAYNLLQSIELLSASGRGLAQKVIAGFSVDAARLGALLERNPMLVTALTPVVGYDRAAIIAKRAHAEGRPVYEVAAEVTGLDAAELKSLLDPARLAWPAGSNSRNEDR